MPKKIFGCVIMAVHALQFIILKERKIHKINLPAKNITNCTFGGTNNSELFITSAIKGLK